MSFIQWNQELEVGHAEIDGQHRKLVDAVNTLHEAMKKGKGREELGQTLAFLANYTVTHFATEEKLMAAHGYTGTAQHKRIHTELLSQVGELVAKHQSGEMVLTLKVMDFLQAWLEKHIQGEDLQLAKFLKGRA